MYIEELKNWLLNEGKDQKTIIAYLYTVRSIAEWYKESTGIDFSPEEITPLDLHDWKSYLQNVKKFKPATINKNIAALKVYWSFLISEKKIYVDPTVKVKMKRSSQINLAPHWLTRHEQAKLLQTVLREKNKWKRERDLAIIQTMLNGGLRISEVVGLNECDIDFKRGTISIQNGKGGKFRVVPINKDLNNYLTGWITERGKCKNSPLFLSERGNRLTERGIQYQVRKYLNNVGLTDATVHCLRHSFCKNLIDQGQPLQVVAQLAGHESLETTRRYITPGEKELRKAIESISWDQ